MTESDEPHPEGHGKTIILSAGDVECAARLLRLITGEEPSSETNERRLVPGATGNDNQQRLLSRAKRVMRNRRLRSDYFNRAIFSEAAWDILLLLYIADSAGSLQTQATLSKGLSTPPTTIQRWVDYLEKERLVRRGPHPTDRRTAFVSLLDKGRDALESYLTAVAE